MDRLKTDDMDMSLTAREENLLQLLERGAEPSDELLEQLRRDESLADDCRTALLAASAVRQEREAPDVEAMLADFHSRHKRTASLRGIRYVILAAAILVGVVFLLNRHFGSSALPSSSPSDPSPSLFVAEADADISLTTAKGQETPIRLPDRPDAQLSVAEMLAEASEVDTIMLRVPNGKSTCLVLDDGSEVWLYPGSSLRMPSRFTTTERSVALSGEAYFRVAHDAVRPFRVSAAAISTTVLGTEFDIAAYEGTATRVTLVSGSVRVEAPKGLATLAPGYQATIGEEGTPQVKQVDTDPYTNWRDGYLYFDDVPVKDILIAIGRNYNVSVECAATEKLDSRMRFFAVRGESLRQLLARFNGIGGICAEYKEGKVICVE